MQRIAFQWQEQELWDELQRADIAFEQALMRAVEDYEEKLKPILEVPLAPTPKQAKKRIWTKRHAFFANKNK